MADIQHRNKGPAGGGDRTHTILRSLDFESSASANSATPAFACDKNFVSRGPLVSD